MKRQFCCTCLKTTDDYDTIRMTDAYGGQHIWHYCRRPACSEAHTSAVLHPFSAAFKLLSQS